MVILLHDRQVECLDMTPTVVDVDRVAAHVVGKEVSERKRHRRCASGLEKPALAFPRAIIYALLVAKRRRQDG